MKTIFITIFQGVEAKNILRTGIYENLIRRPDIRLVFFVANQAKADYYKKEFSYERVSYEVIGNYQSSFWDRFFGALKFKLINTGTMDLRRRMAAEDNRLRAVYYPFSFAFNRIFARPWFRKIVRRLDQWLVKDSQFAGVFEKYKPDAVFLAHLFDDAEIAILREAKKRAVPAVGFINSWDKITARSMMRLQPDKLVVYNEVVKKEAMDFCEMPKGKIVVGGVPHYDHYASKKPSSRETFFKKIKVDPRKRIILCSPIGKYFSNTDWELIDLLHAIKNKGLIPADTEFLFRFQPNDFVDQEEIKKRPWLVYDLPGIRFSSKRGVDWDMNFADLDHLRDTLSYSSLLVCYAASIAVDAAVFDIPVININFELQKKKRASQTPTYFYKMAHYRKPLETGGIRLVQNPEELVTAINQYLANPALDRDKRKSLVEQQCWKVDGHSGQRIAEAILNVLPK